MHGFQVSLISPKKMVNSQVNCSSRVIVSITVRVFLIYGHIYYTILCYILYKTSRSNSYILTQTFNKSSSKCFIKDLCSSHECVMKPQSLQINCYPISASSSSSSSSPPYLLAYVLPISVNLLKHACKCRFPIVDDVTELV